MAQLQEGSQVTGGTTLRADQWRSRQRAHVERVRPWVEPRQQRRRTGAHHPVDDFLFDYYPYSVGKLLTWHPGHGVVLEGEADEFLQHAQYLRVDGGVTTDPRGLERRRGALAIATRLLARTAEREPLLGCFGLHEWAMVYRIPPDAVRHSSYPLRLAPAEISDVVDDLGLRCTHIDAYRFFAPEALPRNAHVPTRADQHEWEQPGCLHANMDLYKYAMWFSPFVASELAADCFDLARSARELDMRAAPYDLADLGYAPIAVETAEGRREYVARQRVIADRASVIRSRLLGQLAALAAAVDEPLPDLDALGSGPHHGS